MRAGWWLWCLKPRQIEAEPSHLSKQSTSRLCSARTLTRAIAHGWQCRHDLRMPRPHTMRTSYTKHKSHRDAVQPSPQSRSWQAGCSPNLCITAAVAADHHPTQLFRPSAQFAMSLGCNVQSACTRQRVVRPVDFGQLSSVNRILDKSHASPKFEAHKNRRLAAPPTGRWPACRANTNALCLGRSLVMR